jgi:hypothetical protein
MGFTVAVRFCSTSAVVVAVVVVVVSEIGLDFSPDIKGQPRIGL